MLKQILFFGAAAVSFPALAQAAQPVPGEDNAQAPTEQVAQPVADQAPAASAGKAATTDQISAIVDKEFATHDSDANGELNAAEFAAWMTKLRASAPQQSASVDPATWAAQAFKVADADSSASVNKAELIGFLSRGA